MWEHPNIWGCPKYRVVQHGGYPNVRGMSKYTSGIQTYGGCLNIWGASNHMEVSKHMGAYKHTSEHPTYGGTQAYWGASKHIGVSKHTGGFQTSGGYPKIWGIQTYGDIQTYRGVHTYGASKHMELSKHTGGIQTYVRVSKIWGHPNIQGAFLHALPFYPAKWVLPRVYWKNIYTFCKSM